MKHTYDICAEYVHCRGKIVHVIGRAGSEAEAAERVMQLAGSPRRKPPRKDPAAYCRAALCPMKAQVPRYYYVEKEEES
jgi:hypothetical protein